MSLVIKGLQRVIGAHLGDQLGGFTSISQLWFSFTLPGDRLQHFPTVFYFVIVLRSLIPVSVVK